MTLDEFKKINRSTYESLIDKDFSIDQLEKYSYYQIEISSFVLNTDQEIDVFDNMDERVGILISRNSINGKSFQSLTIFQQLAYILLVTPEKFLIDTIFESDILLLKSDFKNKYEIKYKEYSFLWGGYTHPENVIPNFSFIDKIQMKDFGNSPTQYHTELLLRLGKSNNIFDRFLRTFQLIELLSDWHIVNEIKKLDTNIKEFTKLFSKIRHDDIVKINLIVETYCLVEDLIPLFLELKNFLNIANEIFNEQGKDSNPLKDSTKWQGFQEGILEGNLSIDFLSSKDKFWKIENNYNRTFLSLASYWIYRIRSSIAHAKIGEFIFLNEHSNFIAKFGEPLLLEILSKTMTRLNATQSN